jgi:type IV pilus assembly protein PilE
MHNRGFTLVELMIVVVIIGVLATVAGTSYKKYTNQGRTAEVMAMIAEFRAKEEAYRAEFNVFCSTGGATCATGTTETTYFPALGAGEPTPKPVAGAPLAWGQLGITTTRTQLTCGYVAVAGAANVAPTGADGISIFAQFPGSAPPMPWYYIHASCDNDGNAATNAIWTAAFNTATVVAKNENK